MARPLSEEKRDAILKAATELVAEIGTGAATAQIAKRAGVADGTLFTYFPTKDDLLNQLYLEIKASLAEAVMASYPAQGGVFERARHLWDRLIDWGASYPERQKAMRKLAVSDRVTQATREEVSAAFLDVNAMIRESVGPGSKTDGSAAFVGALIEAMSDVTLSFIASDPDKAETYKELGFQTFWNGMMR